MTPFRLFKAQLAEGGIRSPLIVSGPGVKGRGEINDKAVLHVMDIMPTALEMAGLRHPNTYQGRKVAPLQGKSWVPMLKGEAQSPRSDDDWLGWELFGGRAIRMGDWKITWLGNPMGVDNWYDAPDWKLFNLARDPGEQIDLSDQYPEKRRELIAKWNEYVKDNGEIISRWNPLDNLIRKGMPDPAPEHDNWPPTYGSEEAMRRAIRQ
jgi:arylsulfatase